MEKVSSDNNVTAYFFALIKSQHVQDTIRVFKL